MSYEIVLTLTKTADTPDNAFTTLPVLAPGEGVTQEQIDALNAAYPMTWDSRVVVDKLIMHNTFRSKEDYDARNADPIIENLLAKRRLWAEANHVIGDIRVL